MILARYRRYHAEQKRALYTLVDPISPPPKPVLAGLWWRRRVLPPGPIGLLRRPFIAISGLRRHHEYKRGRLTKKEPLQGPAHNPQSRRPAVSVRRGDQGHRPTGGPGK